MKQKLNFTVTPNQIVQTPQGPAVLLPQQRMAKSQEAPVVETDPNVKYRIIQEVQVPKESLLSKWKNTKKKIDNKLGKTMLALGSKLAPSEVEVIHIGGSNETSNNDITS
jgi:hypothetical protein